LIKNGTIVTATEHYQADLLIEGEAIRSIGKGIAEGTHRIFDAGGKFILPGGIDGHTHFNAPNGNTVTKGFDSTVAALMGGTTSIVDFTHQPKGLSLLDSIIKHREEAEGKSVVDFGLHAMVTDVQDSIFEELPALTKAGVPTIKAFMAYKGTPLYSDDATIFRMLQKAREAGMLMMVHAENGDVIQVLQQQLIAQGKTAPESHVLSRPSFVEAEATPRAIQLAKGADAPVFIVHVSCGEALIAIREARAAAFPAFGETCPHYLCLDAKNLWKPDFQGAKYVCSPPLRDAADQEQLWKALQNGWLQVVGSDHCGLDYSGQKEMGRHDFTKIPNGLPGIEDRLAILYSEGVLKGRLSMERMVDVFATAPSKFYGMYPKKGTLLPGAEADLVIFDPDYRATISVKTSHQDVDYNIYEGFEQRGRPDKVFLRGQLVVSGGSFTGSKGQGRYIPREPYGSAYQGS